MIPLVLFIGLLWVWFFVDSWIIRIIAVPVLGSLVGGFLSLFFSDYESEDFRVNGLSFSLCLGATLGSLLWLTALLVLLQIPANALIAYVSDWATRDASIGNNISNIKRFLAFFTFSLIYSTQSYVFYTFIFLVVNRVAINIAQKLLPFVIPMRGHFSHLSDFQYMLMLFASPKLAIEAALEVAPWEQVSQELRHSSIYQDIASGFHLVPIWILIMIVYLVFASPIVFFLLSQVQSHTGSVPIWVAVMLPAISYGIGGKFATDFSPYPQRLIQVERVFRFFAGSLAGAAVGYQAIDLFIR